MKATEIIQDALSAANIRNKEICGVIGIQPNSFSKKMTNNTFKAQEMLDILDSMGMEIRLVNKHSNAPVPLYVRGTGPRVIGMVDGVMFDTRHASAVCYSDIESGRYRELYRTSNADFYLVCYSVWSNEKPTVSKCTPDETSDFYEKCRFRHCSLYE